DEQILGPLFGPERDQETDAARTRVRHGRERGLGDRQLGNSSYTFADAAKLFTASSSLSKVSNTVSSFVIDRRSVIRFVRFSSLRPPPCRLTVVYVRTISPRPALSTYGTSLKFRMIFLRP